MEEAWGFRFLQATRFMGPEEVLNETMEGCMAIMGNAKVLVK